MKYWQTLGEFCLLCSFLIDNCVSFPLLTPTICQGAWRKCFLCFIVSRVLEFQMNGAWGSRLKGKSVLTSLSSPFIKPFQMYFAAEFQRRFVFQKFCFGRLEENIDLWGLRGPPSEKCRAGIAKSVHFYRKKACCLDSMTPIQFFYSFRATFRTFTWCLELTVTSFNVLSPPRPRPAPPVENFGAYSRLSNPYKSNI